MDLGIKKTWEIPVFDVFLVNFFCNQNPFFKATLNWQLPAFHSHGFFPEIFGGFHHWCQTWLFILLPVKINHSIRLPQNLGNFAGKTVGSHVDSFQF